MCFRMWYLLCVILVCGLPTSSYAFGQDLPHPWHFSLDAYDTAWNLGIKRPPRPIAFSTDKMHRQANNGFLVSGHYEFYRFFHGQIRLYGGVSLGQWSNIDKAYTLSVVPQIRFYVLQNPTKFNLYIGYSAAGPSFFSKSSFGGLHTGHFFFQDYLSFGIEYANFSVGMKLLHYSSCGLTSGHGFDVPNTFYIEYNF